MTGHAEREPAHRAPDGRHRAGRGRFGIRAKSGHKLQRRRRWMVSEKVHLCGQQSASPIPLKMLASPVHVGGLISRRPNKLPTARPARGLWGFSVSHGCTFGPILDQNTTAGDPTALGHDPSSPVKVHGSYRSLSHLHCYPFRGFEEFRDGAWRTAGGPLARWQATSGWTCNDSVSAPFNRCAAPLAWPNFRLSRSRAQGGCSAYCQSR
jgi:hypothetical protein